MTGCSFWQSGWAVSAAVAKSSYDIGFPCQSF